MEGAKLIGEISTDWGSDSNTSYSEDRLSAFTSSLESAEPGEEENSE